MSPRTYTIGEAARLCGVSVRTLRFYSDAGLLPPAARSDGGYRLYVDADLVRLDLIRALRETGLGIDAIRQVLSRNLTIGGALRLRLAALEAEIAAKRRTAAAIRAALRDAEPTEADVKRIWTMTKISGAERRAIIERFYDEVCEGTRVDPQWKTSMIEASTPELPEEPTPEQVDAWIELTETVTDPTFVAAMRRKVAYVWQEGIDQSAHGEVLRETLAKAQAAIEAGHLPQSAAGDAIAREWIATSARLMGREPDAAFKAFLRTSFGEHDPRKGRYWQLLAILRGEPPETSPNREWAWVIDAMRHHLR